jgi:hypothetical protein
MHRPLPWAAVWGLALSLGACQAALAQATNPVVSPVAIEARRLAQGFDEAMQAYERNQWPQAFAALLPLAEQGHPDAARMVVLMHRHGPRLWGQHFDLTPQQLARYAQTGSAR